MAFSKARRLANLMSADSDEVPSGKRSLASGVVATAKLADNAVTLAKLASGTDGNVISYDASGNPVAVATGTSGQVLTSAGAGAPPTFADAGTVSSGLIADNAVVQAKIANDAVNEVRMQISNAPVNGYVLSAQSGNTGGLTWVELAGGAYSDWSVKTGTYTAVAKDQLIANSGSAFTITLPASPSAGNTVVIHNTGAGTVTIGRNSSNINSTADDGELTTDKSTQLVYVDGTIGWKEI